ncbi:hypothetical protein [Methylophaga sp.]|uniref:hypothetical protein n=1 Tax=Methylophaga sp. TaxID=2024840 RepID=UPI003F6A0873
MQNQIPDSYLDTQFLNVEKISHWPSNFAIISAYATTGDNGSSEQNESADKNLEQYLKAHFPWVRRLISFSPKWDDLKSGWAVNCSWNDACDIGLMYKQDVIYFVSGNTVSVSFCDERRKPVTVGDFVSRLHITHTTQSKK